MGGIFDLYQRDRRNYRDNNHHFMYNRILIHKTLLPKDANLKG